MNRDQIYKTVTDQIIAQLENGTVPWQKEWKDSTGPFNFKTGRPYRGINVWSLSSYEYQSPAWLTFKQIQEMNLKLEKGSKSASVLFWKLLDSVDQETGEIKRIPYPRIYHVFNTEQVIGLEYNPQDCPYECQTSAEELIQRYVDKPPVYDSPKNGCYYLPLSDEVYMVPKLYFKSSEAYYSTLFHELIHSTGHSKRLNRGIDKEFHRFGDPVYSKEELIAEMGAAQLCGLAGISKQTIDNSAAYIKGWLSKLQDDRSILIQASQQAQKAVDYIVDLLPPIDEPTTEPVAPIGVAGS